MRVISRSRGVFSLILMTLLMVSTWALAQTPQTIVIDGVNDFLPGNLIDADGGDTQYPTIDLGDIYITNDAINFYVGAVHDQGGWGSVQLGIAIDLGTADGGEVDPWGRAIEWSAADNKPDFMYYVNLDGNWQASYMWDGAAWADITSGVNSLGWATGTEFNELAIMLGSLGVVAGDEINFEMWVTQDGSTKGPLDASANDDSQLSTPEFTLFDTSAPIPMFYYHSHTVLAASDPDPPVVVEVKPTSYPVDSFFDIFFNEPVGAATAGVAGNYGLPGATVTAAEVDGSDPSIVHLTLDAPLVASATLYQLTVSNVNDLAGNTIIEDGVDNAACFMLKSMTFRGKFGPFLANQSNPPYEFYVEGGTAPLNWVLGSEGAMTDTGVDDIWEFATVMSVPGDCAAGTAVADLEWKFSFMTTTYEPLAGNRVHTLDLANGAADVIEVWWNNEDPTSFTTHDIDVEFFVDVNLVDGFLPGDTVGLNGSGLLGHTIPSANMMVDDGTGNDAVADDGIYSILVTYPEGTHKSMDYKFVLNDVYECDSQGNRALYLNDEMFDTVGGELGPLTLPTVYYDFCNAIFQAVEVVFSVDFNNTAWASIGPADVVSVNGTQSYGETPSFDWSVPSLNEMFDDGVAPDAVAGDKIYTVAVTFPDNSTQNIEYKYLINDVYECSSQANRHTSLDPDNYDAEGNPQVLATDIAQRCDLPTAAPDAVNFGLVLDQNHPNPFNPSTKISFNVPRAGSGSLCIYNIRGELVRTVLSGDFAEGPGVVMWNGRTDQDVQAGSGVYFYRLVVGNDSQTKRMVMLK